jgi:hypothetical protein
MRARANHLFGCTRLKPSQSSVPAGLTLTSEFGFCVQCKVGSNLVLRRPIEITRVTVHDVVREPSSWNPNRNGVMKAYRFGSEGRMGTGGQWIEVILSAVFWGGGTL